MLTCEICGEEVMLEEDMKTHLLLNHLENEMHCPLCSLSGVSYDELSFHISTAHPENQHSEPSHCEEATPSTTSSDCSAPKNTVLTLRNEPQASTSGLIRDSNDTTDEVSPTATSSVTTDTVQHEQDSIENRASSSVMAASWTTVSPKIRQSVKHNNENGDTAKSEQNKDKRKRLCSPRKEKLFFCPMCALVCSDCFTLQEHVELHLEEQHTAEGESRSYECPLCSVICSDSFSLQEHVELHLDQGASVKCAGSPDSDLKLARRLHEEEEQRRKEEEAQQEREEFKKLQRQFGLDGSGGYRRQMERTMERAVARGLMNPAEFHSKRADMMESLASGVDDGRTRAQGVLRALYEYYQTEARDCVHVWLSADTDHYCSSAGDKGWGCGYRNFQMLLSSLLRAETYAPILTGRTVPSIPRLQSMIEEAWKEGLDPRGASHFNQRLQGTRAWIGATEIYSLLTSMGISARIIDFHQPTGPGDTHPRLFEWVKQYYCQSTRSNRIPPRLIQTSLPPLYLQHQGHSRSVVGLEQRKNGTLCLLILDPGSSPSDTRKLLSKDSVSTAVRHIRKFPGNLKHKQYQVVAVQGVLSAEDKRIFSGDIDNISCTENRD